jgi:hypothetical protein
MRARGRLRPRGIAGSLALPPFNGEISVGSWWLPGPAPDLEE